MAQEHIPSEDKVPYVWFVLSLKKKNPACVGEGNNEKLRWILSYGQWTAVFPQSPCHLLGGRKIINNI